MSAPNESRSIEQLREQYEIERELANRLRAATRDERKGMYTAVYDELYSRVPHHPGWTRRTDAEEMRRAHDAQHAMLGRYLRPGDTYLEIGAGDCLFAAEVARTAGRVYAVDVAREVSKLESPPDNFELIISDGTSIPVPPGSVDVAFSNQLMEHLHPDDASEQLEHIFAALRDGGRYVCITPNRLDGPHDVSSYFSDVADGFHLKEWTFTELDSLFRTVGFSHVDALVHLRGWIVRVPASLVRVTERYLASLPPQRCRAVATAFPFRRLLGTIVVGTH